MSRILTMSRGVLAGIATLALFGCDRAPTAPARTPESQRPRLAVSVNETDLPFAFNVGGCSEVVHVEGTFHVVIASTAAASGNATDRFHINAKGTGTGLSSGATYQWNDPINQTVLSRDGQLTVISATQTTTMIGQGDAANLRFRLRFHVTVTANGDVAVIIDEADVIC